MPCSLIEKPIRRFTFPYLVWNRAQPCYPKDNLKLKHECRKVNVVKQTNFIRKNKEAISSYRKKPTKDVANKKMEGLKLLAVEQHKPNVTTLKSLNK